MVEKDDWEEYELIIELIVTQGLIRRGTAYPMKCYASQGAHCAVPLLLLYPPTMITISWRTDYI
ncbi:hypothetical protein CEE36_10480 [candidate division TA06 bacterium B3_TA06]|uniref:Uncharacterized protein n=1 Tax=candidate division TA06 bacterium B3_TA06 TaxID=2012487 RepID=A0A532UVN4_UNCT6|nr:MAG: hypothetical protein CEE36_10480 [candidate division TA06 bacterium B3_TA06]